MTEHLNSQNDKSR